MKNEEFGLTEENWVMHSTDGQRHWLIYDENSSDSTQFIRVQGPYELAERVLDGLRNKNS